jgi:K+-transporting ATPase KdpF subunit
VNILYIVSGVITAGLLVYLFIVLLKPEKFE